MMIGLFKRLLGGGRKITYEEARELAAAPDPKIRAELAGRTDIQPEILYFLAEDSNAEVRRQVACNHQAPPQADLLLAGDGDDRVRTDLAAKIVRLAPGLSANEQDRLRQLTYATLETLARDQMTKVREILADALKNVADAPPEVIRRLARDAEIVVSAPVLQFSPVLTDEDLLEVIAADPASDALAAISKRTVVNIRVADAIAASDDVAAIAALLANPSAQIREETLDHLVDRAPDIDCWHQPLVERPHLSAKTAGKLARFVAASLLKSLAERQDLEPAATVAVATVVRKRLDELEASGPEKAEARKDADETAALMRAKQLMAHGKLDESTIDAALAGGEQAFVTAALAVLAGLSPATVRKTIVTQSAKGIVAVCWKANVSTGLCEQLQAKLLHLPPSRQLHASAGTYPLTQQEMEWQLEFLDS